MADEPLVTILLTPERCREVLAPQALGRLAARATLRLPGPGELTPRNLPGLVSGATVLLTGWGTPPIEEPVLAANPGIALIAHAAGSVRKLLPSGAIGSGGFRVTHAALPIGEAVAEFVIAQALSFLRAPSASPTA